LASGGLHISPLTKVRGRVAHSSGEQETQLTINSEGAPSRLPLDKSEGVVSG
jgi:hypothetical protein